VFDYFLYRIGEFIALTTPLKLGYVIASFVSDVRYAFVPRDRRFVGGNLQVIFPGKSARQIRRLRIRTFRNFAKYLVDFFRFEKLDKEFIHKNVRLENLKIIEQALARGKGVILVTAHLGNWELGGAAAALAGYPFLAVALPHKNKEINDFFDGRRNSKGITVAPLGKAVRSCLDHLKANKIVVLVGDRDFAENGGVYLDFFGRKARFPEGPAAFALKTGAAILPTFMLRNPDDSFTLRIEKPLEFTPSGNKEKDIQELMYKYIRVFEEYIRRYPDQWYMFRRFWVA